jgi:hypothetical protein
MGSVGRIHQWMGSDSIYSYHQNERDSFFLRIARTHSQTRLVAGLNSQFVRHYNVFIVLCHRSRSIAVSY